MHELWIERQSVFLVVKSKLVHFARNQVQHKVPGENVKLRLISVIVLGKVGEWVLALLEQRVSLKAVAS
jgi:hypothetical protein